MTPKLKHPRKCRLAWIAGVTLSFTFVSGSWAQTPDVHVELVGKKVIVADGKESFAKADKAGPGDVIQYEAVYHNTGKAAAKNVVATVPIPQGMALLADSAKPAAEQGTLDSKTFSAFPIMRDVKNEAGAVTKQPVPVAEYRALRWNVAQLAPDQAVTFVLRARLLTNAGAK